MNPSLQVTQIRVPPDFIDLGLGDPAFSLLPLERIQRSAQACFAQGDPAFLQYGAEQGNVYFRQGLAGFLSRAYGFAVDLESLMVTTGASGGLDLLCTLITRPGQTIFVEEPSYFLALRIFADHGLRVVSIAMDADGMNLDELERELARVRPKFVYVIPTFQNPSGTTLSARRRERLAGLSREHDFLVIADEVYHFLDYSRIPPKPLAAWTEIGNIISVGSFSKILAPGLRLGWIQAQAEHIQRLVSSGLLDSGGGMNPLGSALVRNIIEDGGLEENIASLKAVYAERVGVMDAALRRYLPAAEYTLPQGGYFFWIRLPGGTDTAELQVRARDFKVGFRPGVRFSSRDGLGDHARLSFVYYTSEEVEEGVMRLGRCWQAG